jgi:glycosyltransferase involved in cell wall biosynthesis
VRKPEQNGISACIIVRDALPVIQRCIDSIIDYCTEVCVVDTGSSDGTIEYLQSQHISLCVDTSCNDENGMIVDFSQARNQCLGLAKGEWILTIDADEILCLDKQNALDNLDDRFDAFAIRMLRGSTEWKAIRLFRNRTSIRYHYPVHEVPSVSGPVASMPEITIEDLGMLGKSEPSNERNLRICERALAQHPTDARLQFYKAEALRKMNAPLEASHAYMTFLENDGITWPYECVALQRIARLFIGYKRYQEARDASLKALQLHDGLAETYCLLGDASLGLGSLGAAKSAYKKALQLKFPPTDYSLFVSREAYRNYPTLQLKRIENLCRRNGLDFNAF